MYRILMLIFFLTVCIEGCAQASIRNAWLFRTRFLHLSQKPGDSKRFHYVVQKYYTGNDATKRTEEYRYIHNGDEWKAAEGLFNGDELGSNWLKNFDFGKFASVVFEIGGDSEGHPNGGFVWSGKLIFFKVVNQHRIGEEHKSG
jgi:hypothetical protein